MAKLCKIQEFLTYMSSKNIIKLVKLKKLYFYLYSPSEIKTFMAKLKKILYFLIIL